MRYFVTFMAFMAVAFAQMPAPQPAPGQDGDPLAELPDVLATYDPDGKLTREEFITKLGPQVNLMRMRLSMIPEAQRDQMIRQIARGMVYEALAADLAKKAGITADSKTVSDKLAEIKEQLGENYDRWLQSTGLDEEGVREKLVAAIWAEEVLGADIEVPEAEKKAFYEANSEQFDQIQISHILVKTEPGDDEAVKKAARQELEALTKKLGDGADFAELAKEHSSCPSSAEGGDLGWYGVDGNLVPEFLEAAWKLDKGEVSGIVETQFGYHLIKVTGMRKGYDEFTEEVDRAMRGDQIQERANAAIEASADERNVKWLLEETDAPAE